MPASHHSIFTGWILFLTTNQQCQSTEMSATNYFGIITVQTTWFNFTTYYFTYDFSHVIHYHCFSERFTSRVKMWGLLFCSHDIENLGLKTSVLVAVENQWQLSGQWDTASSGTATFNIQYFHCHGHKMN